MSILFKYTTINPKNNLDYVQFENFTKISDDIFVSFKMLFK